MRARMIDEAGIPCEAVVSDQSISWRRQAGDVKCRNHAHYELEGKRLCGKHASQLSLQIMLRE